MPSSMITVAIVATVLIFLMVVFLLQMRERMQDERVREVNASVDRINRLRRMLEELPQPYISKAIRIRVLERIIELAHELKGLDKRRDFRAVADQAAAELEVVRQSPAQPETHGTIQDEAQALEIRKLLKLLFRFIEGEKQEGRLDAKTAAQNMALTSFLIARSIADLYVTKAQAAVANGRLRVAIEQYHNAIDAMEKAQGSPLAQQCILQYRKQIKELDRMASEELVAQTTEAEVKPVEEVDESGNKLSAQWDRIMSEEDKWKKKQAYD